MSSVLYDEPGPRGRRRALIGSVIGALAVLGVLVFAALQLADAGVFESRRWEIFQESDVWTFLWGGLRATLQAAAVAAVIAAALGLVLAVLRMSRNAAVRRTTAVVLEAFRGLPVVLLMFFGVIALGLSLFQGVVFGLVVYNAAIIAEILRAGIVSLPKGQTEAGLAIGLRQPQVLRTILLPQAVRRMLPALISQFVVLLKDTSLGYIVGYTELLTSVKNLQNFFGSTSIIPLFFVGALIYIAINMTLSRVAVWIERRGSRKTAGGVAAADQAQIAGTRATGGEL